jgi:integrase
MLTDDDVARPRLAATRSERPRKTKDRTMTTKPTGQAKPKKPPPPHKFTDTNIKALKPEPGKRESIWFEGCGSGLGVRVSATNVSFIVQLRTKDGGRWRETLGNWGKLTVEGARQAAQTLAGRIAQDVDLHRARADLIAAAAARAETKKVTLRYLLDQWNAKHLVARRASYSRRAVARIENHFKAFLSRPVATITRKEISAALDLVEGPAAKRQAGVSLISLMGWAASKDLITVNPLAGLSLPALTPSRDRVLSAAELRRIWAAAGKLPYPGGAFVKLLLLTGARRDEIARLEWSEIETGDTGLRTVMLPPSRTKTRLPHAIPLSVEALDVLTECPRVVGCRFVFSSDGHTASNDFHRLKVRLDEMLSADGGPPVPPFVLHDFRHAFSTLLTGEDFNEGQGFDPTPVDRQLAHKPAKLSGVGGRYNHQEFLPQRRRILADWGEFVSRPPADVVTLRVKAKA